MILWGFFNVRAAPHYPVLFSIILKGKTNMGRIVEKERRKISLTVSKQRKLSFGMLLMDNRYSVRENGSLFPNVVVGVEVVTQWSLYFGYL